MAIPDFPTTVSVRDFEAPGVVPEGFVLLDIREANEWAAGHAPGAVHFPLSRIPDNVKDLPKENTLLICRSGNRSSTAISWLARKGYIAWNVRGGMDAWKAAGYDVVHDDGTPGTII